MYRLERSDLDGNQAVCSVWGSLYRPAILQEEHLLEVGRWKQSTL